VGAPLIIIITLSCENDVSPGAKIDPERVRPAKTLDAFARAKIIPWRGPTRPQPAGSDFIPESSGGGDSAKKPILRRGKRAIYVCSNNDRRGFIASRGYIMQRYIINVKVRGRTAVCLKTSLKALTPKGDGTHFSLV
jgi:hypothetical protein